MVPLHDGDGIRIVNIVTRLAKAASLATTASVVAFGFAAAPLARADGCTEWSSHTQCRESGPGYTIDCYYYADGDSKCTCAGSACGCPNGQRSCRM